MATCLRSVVAVALLTLLLAEPKIASAACLGADPNWTSTPDRASLAQCINNAAPGSTVTVSAGAATWSSDLAVSKSLTITGAGVGRTVISGRLNIVDALQNATVRLTGFTFDQGAGGNMEIWSTQVFRVDHCRFTRSNHGTLVFVGGHSTFATEGLFDHNEFLNGSIVMFGQSDPGNGSLQWSQPLALGTARAVYVEDNVFEFQAQSGSYPGSLDGNRGSRVVFRFNTNRGGRLEQHSLQADNQRGVRMWEFYNNTFINPTFQNYRPFFIRAGTGVVFHNTTDGQFINNSINIDNSRSSQMSISGSVASFGMCTGASRADGNVSASEGWPCRDQIGRSTDAAMWTDYRAAGPAQDSVPAYFWGNTMPSGDITVVPSCEAADAACVRQNTKHLLANRDFYTSQPNFDGTVGVGEGLLANRPSTCTPGVAYWATDEGDWNRSNSGPDGRLYRCTGTNTWSLAYVPFEYPHPLQRAGSAPPSTPVRVRVQ